jgi:hypothetical protein
MRTVHVLYIDEARSPYLTIPGVITWGPTKDADTYPGPFPVIAHPPCGHWGRYANKAHDDGHNMEHAVRAVRTWGGVLEQPAWSKAFREFSMPHPGERADRFGGYTIAVNQGDWGHPALKPTWLYLSGLCGGNIPPMPDPQPAPPRRTGRRGEMENLAKSKRHLTPMAFALWLVDACRLIRGPALKCPW